MATSKENKTIIRVAHNRENPYVMIHRHVFEDNRLSLKAKGLIGYLLSRPDNWEIMVGDIVRRSRDGRDAVYSAMKELEKYGYMENVPERDEKGKIIRWVKRVYECPHMASPHEEKPLPENPEVGKPDAEEPLPGFPDLAYPDQDKPTLLSTELTNNDLPNKDTHKTDKAEEKNGANQKEENRVCEEVWEELQKRGISVTKKMVRRWLLTRTMSDIIEAAEMATQENVRNPGAYIAALLKNGVIRAEKRTEEGNGQGKAKQRPKEVRNNIPPFSWSGMGQAVAGRNEKYAAFYALIEGSRNVARDGEK